eukprot:Ihof_evm3s220 gene=Ihof_evmTU3s220
MHHGKAPKKKLLKRTLPLTPMTLTKGIRIEKKKKVLSLSSSSKDISYRNIDAIPTKTYTPAVDPLYQLLPSSSSSKSKESMNTDSTSDGVITDIGDEVYNIYLKLESSGYKALANATKEAVSTLNPYAIEGSLPLVCEMWEVGMDIQICGYSVME